MFDQTFVDITQEPRKPASIALSLLMQAAALCMLAALPLIYTQTLPLAQLKDLIVAPAPPQPAALTHQHVRTQARPSVRPFVAPQFVAPARVAAVVHTAQDAPAAPEVGSVGSAQGAPGSAFDGLVAIVHEAPPPPPPASKEKLSSPLRVGGNVAAANLVHRVQPVYPPLAR